MIGMRLHTSAEDGLKRHPLTIGGHQSIRNIYFPFHSAILCIFLLPRPFCVIKSRELRRSFRHILVKSSAAVSLLHLRCVHLFPSVSFNLSACVAALNKEPFHRDFWTTDARISYPYHEDTITPFVGAIIPTGIFLATAVVLEFHLYRRRHRWVSVAVASLLFVLLDSVSAAILVECMYSWTNVATGMLRPSFLAVCDPATSGKNPECTGSDAALIEKGRRSFPSGHTSFAYAVALYNGIYVVWTLWYRDGGGLLRECYGPPSKGRGGGIRRVGSNSSIGNNGGAGAGGGNNASCGGGGVPGDGGESGGGGGGTVVGIGASGAIGSGVHGGGSREQENAVAWSFLDQCMYDAWQVVWNIVTVAPAIAAWIILVSRVVDNKHAREDVIGAVALAAMVTWTFAARSVSYYGSDMVPRFALCPEIRNGSGSGSAVGVGAAPGAGGSVPDDGYTTGIVRTHCGFNAEDGLQKV
ncbi:unnamed protein product [Phaeothamnion confervicola]